MFSIIIHNHNNVVINQSYSTLCVFPQSCPTTMSYYRSVLFRPVLRSRSVFDRLRLRHSLWLRLLVKKWHLQLLYVSKNNPEVPVIMFSLDLPNITKEKKKDSKKYFFYVFTQLEGSRSRLQKFRLRLTQNAVTDRLRLRNTDSNHIDFTQ